jgi:hypothetical protein
MPMPKIRPPPIFTPDPTSVTQLYTSSSISSYLPKCMHLYVCQCNSTPASVEGLHSRYFFDHPPPSKKSLTPQANGFGHHAEGSKRDRYARVSDGIIAFP